MRPCTKLTDRGHDLCLRFAQHSFGRVDRDDLGFRCSGQQCGGRRTGAAARVEQPQSSAAAGIRMRATDIRKCSW